MSMTTLFNNGTHKAETSGSLSTPAQEKKITRLAFLSRFTDAEAVAIDLASIDDPSGTESERQQQAQIRRFLNKVNAATFIDLSLQDTVNGVNALASLNLITSARATAILNDTIQANERA